jgi:hypothetical protein
MLKLPITPLREGWLGSGATVTQKIIMGAIVRAKEDARAGRGEVANNWGPDVFEYRRTDGTGRKVTTRGAWCASSASSILRKSAKRIHMATPFETSRGARRLVRNALAHPEGFDALDSEYVRESVGGLVCWKRRGWRGHIEYWYDYCPHRDTLYTVGGNHRKPGEKLAYMNEFSYPAGSWRKRLYKIVGF